ncbi:MAG TPA: hypothetical protein HPP51_00770 [Planctomycetes bacterium]|nr:hypothetical protein [Planctomycetota bacterium]
MVAAAVPLYDFQKEWVQDRSRFKIGCIARQCGKSFMVALEAALDAAETGDTWILLSAGERQSKELMEKVKMHLEAMKVACGSIENDFFHDTQFTMLTIRLANGGRIIGLPANPETARGFSGNVVLDEFAFHRDSEKIWKALFPTISRGYKIRIVSTPQGIGNRFHRLCTGDNRYSRHFVDIFKAVAGGVPHNIDDLKEGIDDDDAWNQEYLILFVDDESAWLTYDMIAACCDVKIPGEIGYENFDIGAIDWKPEGRVFAGMDIGRKKDLTVIDIEEQLGDVFWNRLSLVMHKTKFATQQETLWRILNHFNVERVCIDSTGIGAQLAEGTVDKFGAYRAEQVDFTAGVKQDLAVRTRRKFEDRLCRVATERKLRDDLHAVKKTTTAAGNVRFDAERTKDGHADRFWAKSLAFMAGDSGAKPQCIII